MSKKSFIDEIREEMIVMSNLAQGIKEEERSRTFLIVVRNLMETMNFTANQAIDTLKIPEEERENIKNQLCAENTELNT